MAETYDENPDRDDYVIMTIGGKQTKIDRKSFVEEFLNDTRTQQNGRGVGVLDVGALGGLKTDGSNPSPDAATFRTAIGAMALTGANAAMTSGQADTFRQVIGLGAVRTVESFGAVGDGVTDDRAAFQAGVDAMLDGDVGCLLAFGTYAIGTAASGDTKAHGILTPYTNVETALAPRVTILCSAATKFLALANDMIVFRISDPWTQILGFPQVDGNGFTGVWAFGLVPEDMDQTATAVAQSYCKIEGRVKNCYAAYVLQGGPQVATVDSACWYNHVTVFSEYCTIHRWIKPATTAASVVANRNRFYGRANRCNVGGWNQGGNTNDDWTYYEGVIEGVTPFATPTAIVQEKTTGVPGSTLDNNSYYGTIEACTRWVQCDYTDTNLHLPLLDMSKVLFNERPQLISGFQVGDGYVHEAQTLKGAARIVTPSIMAGDAVDIDTAVEVQGDFRNAGTAIVRVKSNTSGHPEFRIEGTTGYGSLSRYVDGTKQWSIGNQVNGNTNIGFYNYQDVLMLQIRNDGDIVPGTIVTKIGNSVTPWADVVATKFSAANGDQLLGARGAAVVDATDAASAITQLNALLARLRAHGLIAT